MHKRVGLVHQVICKISIRDFGALWSCALQRITNGSHPSFPSIVNILLGEVCNIVFKMKYTYS